MNNFLIQKEIKMEKMEIEKVFCQYCKREIQSEIEIKNETCLFCEKNFVFQSSIVNIFGYLICEGLKISDLTIECLEFEFHTTKEHAQSIIEFIKDQKYINLFDKMEEMNENPIEYIGKAEQIITEMIG